MRYVSRPYTSCSTTIFGRRCRRCPPTWLTPKRGTARSSRPDDRLQALQPVALVHGCSTFMGFVVKPHRQMGSHIGFRTDDLREIGFPSKDGLFDELTFQEHFDRAGKKVCQVEDVFLEKVPRTSPRRCWSNGSSTCLPVAGPARALPLPAWRRPRHRLLQAARQACSRPAGGAADDRELGHRPDRPGAPRGGPLAPLPVAVRILRVFGPTRWAPGCL